MYILNYFVAAGFDPMNQAGPAPPLEPKPEERCVITDWISVLSVRLHSSVNRSLYYNYTCRSE